MHFLQWKCMNFGEDFTEVCSLESCQQYSIIGTDNGLVPNRWQAIIWTHGGWFTDEYMHHLVLMSYNEIGPRTYQRFAVMGITILILIQVLRFAVMGITILILIQVLRFAVMGITILILIQVLRFAVMGITILILIQVLRFAVMGITILILIQVLRFAVMGITILILIQVLRFAVMGITILILIQVHSLLFPALSKWKRGLWNCLHLCASSWHVFWCIISVYFGISI